MARQRARYHSHDVVEDFPVLLAERDDVSRIFAFLVIHQAVLAVLVIHDTRHPRQPRHQAALAAVGLGSRRSRWYPPNLLRRHPLPPHPPPRLLVQVEKRLVVVVPYLCMHAHGTHIGTTRAALRACERASAHVVNDGPLVQVVKDVRQVLDQERLADSSWLSIQRLGRSLTSLVFKTSAMSSSIYAVVN